MKEDIHLMNGVLHKALTLKPNLLKFKTKNNF